MRRFLSCENGNMAVAFALSLLPLMGAVGAAVDYSRATNVHAFLQSQADMAALSGAQLGPDGADKPLLNYVQTITKQRYGDGSWIDAMSVSGSWISDVDYQVKVSGKVRVSVLAAVPGFPDEVPVSVVSVVRIAEPRYVYTPPTMTQLDGEAGDYNRIYVYCFDETKKHNHGTHGRTQMTAIADNAGTAYHYNMPRCDAGQTLSYRLLNVRLARTDPSKWDDPKALHFNYYTDTTVENGADTYDLGGWSVLETVLCKNLNECKPKSQGGIIPEGKNRDPVQAKATCSPGKYMYYGWEDRPPGMSGPSADWTDIAWTDRDYDDIRIVIACPSLEAVQDRQVRLVN
jgi:Flp pilus assembly protein TadG